MSHRTHSARGRRPRGRVRLAVLVPTMRSASYWQPIVRELAARTELRVFTGDPWPGFDDAPHPAVRVVGTTRRRLAREDGEGGYGGGVLVASPAVVVPLTVFRPDVVASVTFGVWTLLALALKPLLRWRVVVLWEGSSPRVDYREDRARTIVRRRMLRRADAVVTNSRAGRDYLVDVLGADVTKVHHRPYQLPDPSALRPDGGAGPSVPPPAGRGRVTFLVVGQLIRRKGLLRLLDAAAVLRARGIDGWRIVVAGRGPLEDELRARVTSAGLDAHVHIAGFVPYADLGAWFDAADVFVLPTLEDTWGMVVPEAMASGTPALVSRWAGASDLVDDGVTGFVFDPHEPEQLADLMARFVAEPALAERMGALARARMEDLTHATGAAALADVAVAAAGRTTAR